MVAYHYSLFGGSFESEIAFPELSSCNSTPDPDMRLTIGPTATPVEGELIGQQDLGWGTCRLFQQRAELILDYSILGVYTLNPNARITYRPRAHVPIDLVRSVVLGPVAALALEQQNQVCLHGSAVALAEHCVAFLGPKHVGKSTIALALVRDGARLAGDDVVIIDTAGTPVVRPGVHAMKLWPDILRSSVTEGIPHETIDGSKPTVTALPASRLMTNSVPLSAVYVLIPTAAASQPARRLLSRSQGAVAMALNAKLPDPLVGLHAAAARLDRMAALSERVAVFELVYPPGIGHLAELTSLIREWHRTPTRVFESSLAVTRRA